jgi:ribosomal protein S6
MMKIRFLLSFIVFASFCSGMARAQIEVTLSIKPERDTIIIGDQATLEVSVIAPKDEVIIFPDFKEKLTEGIELIEATAVDTLKSKDGKSKHWERKYRITSFDEGRYHFKGFPVLKVTPSGVDTLYSSNEIVLIVKTVELDENFQPYDVKDIKTYPSQWWLWGGIAAIAALLVTALAAFIVKKYRRNDKTVKLKINPYSWAMYELDKLKTSNLSSTQTKEYYSQLTDIVREYIELQTNVSAMEKTSDEILSLLPDTIFNSEELLQNIRDLFSVADLVKFAKYPASTFECETSLNEAYKFVTQSNNIANELKQSENEDSGDIGNTAV